MQRVTLLTLFAWTVAACSSTGHDSTGPGVAISVAPLTLSGVTNATYRLVVENGSHEVVADVALSSDQYGDGAGSLSYVAPCDADDNDNAVQLTLLDLYEQGSATPIATSSYVNPGTLTRTITCLPNADVAVTFDLTIARAATQGFFDVAIELDEVFCSAKLDCLKDPSDPSSTIALLFNGAQRDTTFVMGFACTGGPSASGETWQYLDDVDVTCGADAVRVDVGAGSGVLPASAFSQLAGTQSPLFGAAVYRGSEQLVGYDKQYWNVALGFDGGADCHLSALGTASSGALAGGATPNGTTWPLVVWDVALTDGSGAIVCTQHPINAATCPGSGVCVDYTALDAPETFDNAYAATLPTATCTPGSQVFVATGADQVFVVPAGCEHVGVRMWGAGGGGSTGGNSYAYRSAGGGGGFATGFLAVTPGEALTVVVGEGGAGSDDTAFTPYGGGTPATGFQGSGGGGGRSAVRRAAGTEEITAGGGGGGGYGTALTAGTPGGGAAGGASTDSHDGTPGTQSAGGTGGGGTGGIGGAGAPYQGGTGARYCGGGGGGYYGGGGGGFASGIEAGSGAGGSGYVGGAINGETRRGTGATPALAGEPDLPAGVAVGGAPGASGTWSSGSPGGSGLVIISWGATPSLGVDPDAEAFITTAADLGAPLTQTEAAAIRALVADLKVTGAWDGLYAVYPMVGGTSATAVLELESGGAPAMSASLVGAIAVASDGVTGAGGYFEVAVTPADLGAIHGLYAYVNRVDEDTTGTNFTNAIVSVRSPLTNAASLQEYMGNLLTYSGSNYFDLAYAAKSTTSHTRLPQGGYSMMRSSASRLALFRNGALDTQNTILNPAPLTLNSVRFGVLAHGGEQASSAFAARAAGAAFISGPFSDAEVQALHDAFASFNAALGREALP